MKWEYLTLGNQLPLHLTPLGSCDLRELPPGSPVSILNIQDQTITIQYRRQSDDAPVGLLATIRPEESLALGRLGKPGPSWVAYRVDGGQEHGLLLTVASLAHVERPEAGTAFTIALEQRAAAELNRLALAANQSIRAWFEDNFQLPGFGGPLYLYQARKAGPPQQASLIGRTHRLQTERTEIDGVPVLIGSDLKPLRNHAEALRLPCALQGEVLVTTLSLYRRTLGGPAVTAAEGPADETEQGPGYFQLWRRYVELERALLPPGLEPIAYDGFELGDEAETLEIELQRDLPEEWPLDETPALLSMREPPEEGGKPRGNRIGRAVRADGKRLVISRNPDRDEMPFSEGFLAISYAADEARIRRREDALHRIFSGDGQWLNRGPGGMPRLEDDVRMPGLGLYLDQPGTCNAPYESRRKAVTNKLKQSMGRDLTPDQESAVAKALNTPDFALIMGPPGTGKTTVIRAIVERLKEEGHKAILLSAAQQVAVDNMASRITWQEVPVLRLGGAQGEEGRDRSGNRLLRELRTALDEKLEALDDHSPQRLRDRAEEDLLLLGRSPGSAAQQADRLSALLQVIGEQNSPTLRQQGDYLLLQLQRAANRPVRADRVARETGPEAVRSLLRFRPVSAAAYRDGGSLWLERLRHALAGAVAAARTPIVREAYLAIGRVEELGSGSLQAEPEGDATLDEALAAVEAAVDAALPAQVTDREMLLLSATQPNLNLLGWLRDVVIHLNQALEGHPDQRFGVVKRFVERLESDSDARYAFLRRHSPATAVSLQQSAKRDYGLGETAIEYLIIDEAARANPLDLMIPFALAEHIIMVGDPKQLPQMLEPAVDAELSMQELKDHESRALRESLFQRLYEGLPESRREMLTTQFRMTPVVGDLVSELFYGGDVKPGPSLPMPDYALYQDAPLVWVRCRRSQETKVDGSWRNQREARTVAEQVERLLQSRPDLEAADGDDPKIGVITFYRAQVRALEAELGPLRRHCAVGTVDAFQGREFDVVFLSIVRSNARGQLGHVAFQNRLCVSLSRARKCLVIVGDDVTAAASPDLKKIFEAAKGGAGRVVES